jgi:hypothetical protein
MYPTIDDPTKKYNVFTKAKVGIVGGVDASETRNTEVSQLDSEVTIVYSVCKMRPSY